MQHLIFLSFQYRKYSNCYIIALQYFLKYGSAIIQQLLHLIFLFLQVEHIAIAILLHCNILIILQCNNIAIAIFSISSFKLQFYLAFLGCFHMYGLLSIYLRKVHRFLAGNQLYERSCQEVWWMMSPKNHCNFQL